MRHFIIIFWVLITYGAKSQFLQTLPNDPITVKGVAEYNWLKTCTESAINDGSSNYDNLEAFKYSYSSEGLEEVYWKALSYIGRSSILSRTVFNWAKPFIKSKIFHLPKIEKIKLHNSLTYIKSYLEQLDYNYEEKYLTAQKSTFIYLDPHDFFDTDFKQPFPSEIADDKRNMAAFVFRRMQAGVSKEMMLDFLNQVISYIDVNFSEMINATTSSKQYKFFWNGSSFEGKYYEYELQENYGVSQYLISVIGNYQNGEKHGTWYYYSFDGKQNTIKYKVDYQNGEPTLLTRFSRTSQSLEDLINNRIGNVYSMKLELSIPSKVLKVDVYDQKNKLVRSYNSQYDAIAFWDIYGAERRVEGTLTYTNVDSINAETSVGKPIVERNKKTNNYVFYDELKRSGKDHALFIANKDYINGDNFPSLDNPIRDAQAIAAILSEDYGFECQVYKDPIKSELLSILNTYKIKKFAEDEQLFIYYSGHGSFYPSLQQGYIVPKDGKNEYKDVNHESFVSYDELQKLISEIHCKHIFFAIDACYSGAFELAVAKTKDDRRNGTTRWFMINMSLNSKYFLASTSSNRKSSDGIGHSPFASAIIHALKTYKGIGGPEYYLTHEDIAAIVKRDTNGFSVLNHFGDSDQGSTFFFIMK
ncbi:MAG: peptidase caspase catalytic subunit p20 [Segetibacter sp.]|nr:peptidase caspase catalytic subunit p20 [Segetibacter sp.]